MIISSYNITLLYLSFPLILHEFEIFIKINLKEVDNYYFYLGGGSGFPKNQTYFPLCFIQRVLI